MKVPTHIIGHYHRSVRRYKKIIARIRQNHDRSSYQYRNLIQALRKKIAALHFQLKIQIIDRLFITETIKEKAHTLIRSARASVKAFSNFIA